MKYINNYFVCFLTLLSINLTGQSQVNWIKGDFKPCSTTNQQVVTDSIGKSPKWRDSRVHSNNMDDIHSIIEEGAKKAFEKLKCAGNYSNIVKIFNYCDSLKYAINNSRTSLDNAVYTLSHNYSKVKIRIFYVPIDRSAGTAGRIYPKLKHISCDREKPSEEGYMVDKTCCGQHFRNYCYWSDTDMKKNNSNEKICFKEEVYADVEIFSEIFKRKEFWIPSSEKRWARTPVEAVSYIILHEMAHLENFLYEESKYNECIKNVYGSEELANFSEDEETAWEYASSVAMLRCD